MRQSTLDSRVDTVFARHSLGCASLRDSQNFIYDEYREKISWYSVYCDSAFETIKNYCAAQKRTGGHL